ncbi:glycosyltransferase family 4 protein [uncultured Algoriphagus sp.]|uniref:glycosyltransferase family 4 protein n=1 Tax=uncultured Algoriphagus sp. TaxID=417365 RepID=UPI0030EBF95C|tara:strand:+ start:57224 stop:58327 length:1104 start_codon:yes stop_codon:yes gene_type:complete
MQKALFLLSIPPPVHGASMMGKYIQDSKVINQAFSITYINLNTSTSVDEIGGQGIAKYLRIVSLFFKVLVQLILIRPHFTYMTPTAGGMGFYKDWPLAMICKLFSGKFIAHFHNKGASNYQDSKVDNWLYRRFFNNTYVILLAEELYTDICKYVGRERLYICPNGIPDPYQELVSKESNEPLKLLFLSNLIREKGIFDLLQAIALLKKDDIPVQCTIVGGDGDISEKELLEEIALLDIKEQIDFLGKRYGSEKLQLIQSSDIFVFPTYYRKECFPLVLLEAMAFGLPIITTTEGGIPSIIRNEENGLILKSKDPQNLSLVIRKLLYNKEMRSLLGKAARKDFSQEFTLEKFEQNFLRNIEQIVLKEQ